MQHVHVCVYIDMHLCFMYCMLFRVCAWYIVYIPMSFPHPPLNAFACLYMPLCMSLYALVYVFAHACILYWLDYIYCMPHRAGDFTKQQQVALKMYRAAGAQATHANSPATLYMGWVAVSVALQARRALKGVVCVHVWMMCVREGVPVWCDVGVLYVCCWYTCIYH